MTTNGDGRLASALLLLATGVGAVLLVEQRHSRPRPLRTDFAEPLLAAPLAATTLPGVIDRAYAAEAARGLSASRSKATAFQVLPGGEVCR
jgi:hypothetical protein